MRAAARRGPFSRMRSGRAAKPAASARSRLRGARLMGLRQPRARPTSCETPGRIRSIGAAFRWCRARSSGTLRRGASPPSRPTNPWAAPLCATPSRGVSRRARTEPAASPATARISARCATPGRAAHSGGWVPPRSPCSRWSMPWAPSSIAPARWCAAATIRTPRRAGRSATGWPGR